MTIVKQIKGVCWLALLALTPLMAWAGRVEQDLSGPGWRLWWDAQAQWENDELFLPGTDLSRIPANPPTGGWGKLDDKSSMAVSVPGTVEQYLYKGPGPDAGEHRGLMRGVSWWWRTIRIPESSIPAPRILLRVESARLRSEVYLDDKLVGYDIVGNTPYEIDLTPYAKSGQSCRLAIRITNPGGYYHWIDYHGLRWGNYRFPMSHGFGGITGGVKLLVCAPTYVDDLYMQNLPAMTQANAIVTVKNTSADVVARDVQVRVVSQDEPRTEVFSQLLKAVSLKPGTNPVTVPVTPRQVKLWDLDNPCLYVCEVTLGQAGETHDVERKTFGFRWFTPDGIGTNAVLRLNGRRIVLRTAIDWGFWPFNGVFPSPELAERQIRTAKELGLNMLNFHRCIGRPIEMDRADEQGLLFFEEPGGYQSAGTDPFARILAREKLLRMIRRDRSHPSMVIYNMINEIEPNSKASYDVHRKDMADAHALDPSRLLLYTSAWATKPGQPEDCKLHTRPFDDQQYRIGWHDEHRFGGPVVWREDLYRGPREHYGRGSTRSPLERTEIRYWGEEGAVSSPPRLALMKREIGQSPWLGWDGQVYLDWYKAFADLLERKKLMPFFPTVDALCLAMGTVSHEHQGRKIQLSRIADETDGYAVNGWEAETVDNHSGVVDVFRNPKADPAILSHYNQPLYVAVLLRSQVVQIPGKVIADFFVVNEKNLTGPLTLKLSLKDPAGKECFQKDVAVKVSGGETYGELLAEAVEIPIEATTGMFRLDVRLVDAAGQEKALGRDEILAVDWKSQKLTSVGAVYAADDQVRNFLAKEKGLTASVFDGKQGRLDWLVVTRSPFDAAVPIPDECLRNTVGDKKGLEARYYLPDKKEPVLVRQDAGIDFEWKRAVPDPLLANQKSFRVVWEGKLVPTASDRYRVQVKVVSGAMDLFIKGQRVLRTHGHAGPLVLELDLEAGKPVPVRMEYQADLAGAAPVIQLGWSPLLQAALSPAKLLERVANDGTTLLLMRESRYWMDILRKRGVIRYGGDFRIQQNWIGGQYFVREHPLFKGLPVNRALDWPYQAVVDEDAEGARYALNLEGEELVVGAYQSYPFALGTAVGVIPFGKGRIVVSTLDISPKLSARTGPAEVARKLMCNYIEYVSTVKQ